MKKIRTNTKGKTVGAQCRPAKSSAAGEVRFCDVTVSKKSHCPLHRYDRLKVTVKVRATGGKRPGRRILDQDLEGSPLRID